MISLTSIMSTHRINWMFSVICQRLTFVLLLKQDGDILKILWKTVTDCRESCSWLFWKRNDYNIFWFDSFLTYFGENYETPYFTQFSSFHYVILQSINIFDNIFLMISLMVTQEYWIFYRNEQGRSESKIWKTDKMFSHVNFYHNYTDGLISSKWESFILTNFAKQ